MKNELSTQFYLQRIINILLINGGFLENVGLYTGEMGLVLFFFRYARYTGNGLYKDYGFDLIEKIQNRLHNETPIDYKQGTSGIGSAIEYLVQEGFIDADTDEILEEFDHRIFSMCNPPDLSIENVLSTGYYAIWRLSGNSAQKDNILTKILPPIVAIMSDWNTKHDDLLHQTVSLNANDTKNADLHKK